MASLLLALLAALLLAGLAGLIVFFAVRARSSHSDRSARTAESAMRSEPVEPRGPKTTNAFWTEERPGVSRTTQWRRPRATAPNSEEERYQAPQGTWQNPEKRWNPYETRSEKAARVRGARGRARQRSAPAGPNYYTLLGVDPGASDQEIERAYRVLVTRLHPDRFFDDPERRTQAEEQLKEINRAMQVLRDPLERARYDATI